MSIHESFLPHDLHKEVHALLLEGGWMSGWKSRPDIDVFSFWHRHFAGARKPYTKEYDCEDELHRFDVRLFDVWKKVQPLTGGDKLTRCYANAYPYGTDGTLHNDSMNKESKTCIYFPMERWHPNWGGETVFFNDEKTDILASVYPMPNRLLIFPGNVYHLARGVSRTCTDLRVTLMFKTEARDG